MVNIIDEGKDVLDKGKDVLDKGKEIISKKSGRNGWLNKILKSKDDESSLKQLAISGASGWLTGYTFTKFGKLACFGVGVSMVGLYIGNRTGYLKIDMRRVDRDAAKAKKELDKIKKSVEKELPRFYDKARQYVADNALLVLGFSAGYCFGVASA